MITNSRSVGGFKNLTGKNVDMNDGLFEVTLIRHPKNPLQLQEIMTALVMAEDNTDMIYSFKSKKLMIETEEEVPWTRTESLVVITLMWRLKTGIKH